MNQFDEKLSGEIRAGQKSIVTVSRRVPKSEVVSCRAGAFIPLAGLGIV